MSFNIKKIASAIDNVGDIIASKSAGKLYNIADNIHYKPSSKALRNAYSSGEIATEEFISKGENLINNRRIGMERLLKTGDVIGSATEGAMLTTVPEAIIGGIEGYNNDNESVLSGSLKGALIGASAGSIYGGIIREGNWRSTA